MKLDYLKKINDYIWEVPKEYRTDMKVPAMIFADEKILKDILEDKSIDQLINVSTLPGIQKVAIAMPDIHEGYGFPIGGVAAFDLEEGIISPGGIGYDINCGVRVLKTSLLYEEIKKYLSNLATQIQRDVPSGVGRGQKKKLSSEELNKILKNGAKEIFNKGFATQEDLNHTEAFGCLLDANPDKVSKHAKERGYDQVGTIGAGNHFIEIQIVEKIFDEEIAKKLDLKENEVTIMVHCGSRGLGHQVATDYIQIMLRSLEKYKIKIPDPELACAPISSPEGKDYWQAMAASANFAWANRQFITWEIRQAWKKVLGNDAPEIKLIYDVAHNIAKIESYFIDGKEKKLCVHRKGATRAFPKNHPELPQGFKEIGQPVLIPGSMGTASYILIGQETAIEKSFGSTCHGAGRVMSRTKAKKQIRGSDLKQQLEKQGIIVRCSSMAGLAEEAPFAYKDVNEVVDIVHNLGLAKKVVRLRPIAVIKG